MRNIWVGKILELAINGYKKYLSWKKTLKCSINEFKKYLRYFFLKKPDEYKAYENERNVCSS
jgi:hypothetical protein